MSLTSSAIAIAIAASTPVTSLHHRAYSLAMCVVYIASSAYFAHRSGMTTEIAVLRTMTSRKTAIVAVGGTGLLTLVFAVNGKERTLPPAHAVIYIVTAAIAFCAASLSLSPTAADKTGCSTRHAMDGAIAKGLAGTACLLAIIAISSSRHKAVLLTQAFVFTVAAVAAWTCHSESLAVSSASNSSILSRTSSSATLAVHPESQSNSSSPDKKPKAMIESDVEDSRERPGLDCPSSLERLPAISGERWRMACFGILLLPILAWIGRHAAVLIGAAEEQSMSIKSFGWQREADYDMYVRDFSCDAGADSGVSVLWRTTTRTRRSSRRRFRASSRGFRSITLRERSFTPRALIRIRGKGLTDCERLSVPTRWSHWRMSAGRARRIW